VDVETFRCLALAYDAGREGGTAPAVLNAANEVAVAAFLEERLPFLGIAETVSRVLEGGVSSEVGYGRADIMLEDVLHADEWARDAAAAAIVPIARR
jgi:1-deoxy-D-xylulose-5-phosphate reductoisomerase